MWFYTHTYTYIHTYNINISTEKSNLRAAKIRFKSVSQEKTAAAGAVWNKTQEELINNFHFSGMSYSQKNGFPKRDKAEISHINTTLSSLGLKVHS